MGKKPGIAKYLQRKRDAFYRTGRYLLPTAHENNIRNNVKCKKYKKKYKKTDTKNVIDFGRSGN